MDFLGLRQENRFGLSAGECSLLFSVAWDARDGRKVSVQSDHNAAIHAYHLHKSIYWRQKGKL
jgi:hypothetical protein